MDAATKIKIDDALSILDVADQYKNLHGGITSILFFACAGFSVRTFFWISDFTNWLGFGSVDPILPSTIAFIMIFVVWIFSFLAIMSALEAMGLRDVEAMARLRLSTLTLRPDELRQLRDIASQRNWRNGQIFESVVADLITAHLEP